jgi:hypothetical protein
MKYIHIIMPKRATYGTTIATTPPADNKKVFPTIKPENAEGSTTSSVASLKNSLIKANIVGRTINMNAMYPMGTVEPYKTQYYRIMFR